MDRSRYADLGRPPLSADVLRRAVVSPGSGWVELDVVDEASSTNALLVARASDDARSGLVVIAEYQAAGRGRLDRAWVAPPRSGLTMSALVRPSVPEVARWPWISLIAGLAAAAAIRSVAEVEATLKWPNDVVVADRKLGGILVERVDPPRARPAAVVGVGLNVSQRRDELPTTAATSLALENATSTDRSLLARAVLRGLDALLRTWEAADGDPSGGLLEAYSGACSTLGRRVRVELLGGESAEGEAVRVDLTGRIVVRTPAGEQAFGSGDVVHLTPDP